MYEGHDQAIFELLTEARTTMPDRLETARVSALAAGVSLADQVAGGEPGGMAAVLSAVATHLRCELEHNLPAVLPGDAIAAVPANVAHRYGIAPLAVTRSSLRVAAVDPFDPNLASELSFVCERAVEICVAYPARIQELIGQHYGQPDPAATLRTEEPAPFRDIVTADTASERELQQWAEQVPVVRAVDAVLARAVADGASDIHFEPFEREFRIRYRVDGTLRDLPSPPSALALPVISRLKVLGNLNIAERRVPQDGRIHYRVGTHRLDLRLSTLPTQFGESAVLRVLDQSAIRLSLGELGLPASLRAGVESTIRRPNGIFVVTGPTGAGKTTTLYACLQALNVPEAKLLTIEDPVEYEIEGIMQVPVNPASGLTFARALRAFLRQDPDVVMVGEIRDLETAQIAIQAALTGHLVLTTLHTNDAISAVARLLDLGVEPFLLASALEGVLAQRLLKRLCPVCRSATVPDAESWRPLGLNHDHAKPVYVARGCGHCAHTGYRGRVGIFEFLPISESFRERIVTGGTLEQLRDLASVQDMTTLRAAALAAMHAGETTPAEVLKYT